MRQVGSLPEQRDAERFAAYLVTQGIDAHAELDTEQWAIWVRDEDRLASAREAFSEFQLDPQHQRYRGVERDAEAIRREDLQRRSSAQRNVVEMRSRWHQPGARRAPFTMTLIALSVAVTLVSGFGEAKSRLGQTVIQQLSFCNRVDYVQSPEQNPLVSLSKGEVWRVVTPIFLHLDWLHLIFNMVWLYQLGSLLESLKGSVRLGVFVLLIAVLSNLAQALMPQYLGGSPMFGGMSGVVYGLFGYVWIRSTFLREPGFAISQSTVIIMLVWLFLCMTPAIPNVANVAHVVGLLTGVCLAYVPSLWR
jgi:GlpG protein